MSTCAVISCPNVVKGNKKADTVLHCFPKDPVFAQKWIAKCGRPPTFRTTKARICSDHFSSQNYARDLFNELRGLPTRKKGFLKETAVPDLCLPQSFKESAQSLTSHLEPGLSMHGVPSAFTGNTNDGGCIKKGVKASSSLKIEQGFAELSADSMNFKPVKSKKLNIKKMPRPSFKAGAVGCVERMEKEVKLFKKQSETLCKELEECKARCRKGEHELMRVRRREHLLKMRVKQLRMEMLRLRNPRPQDTSAEGAGVGLLRNLEAILQYGKKRAAGSANGTVLWGACGVDVLYHG